MVRPTSETIVNTYFAKWIQSYRDLPLLINQWANVVRWELRPRVFLRTTEFLWQEGHTCHATEDDARDYAAKILHDVYADFMVNVLAMPVLPGRKTARERFPGATNTLTVEAMMGDGKALQMGTSHELGQNFAKVFETQYSSESGSLEYVWQTSWGSSTRMVGGLIMGHGDDAGLRVPPRLAPIQVVVLLVRGEDGAAEAAERLARELRGVEVRTEIDTRTDLSFGRRVADWELKGVPVRVEVGPRDLATGVVTLARRDIGSEGHGAGRGGRAPGAVTARAHPGRAARRGDSPAREAHGRGRDRRGGDRGSRRRVRPAALGQGRHRGRRPDAGGRRHRALPAPRGRIAAAR